MYGLTINLLMDTEKSSNDLGMSILPHLVWSTYDRIHFKEIKDFKDYFAPEKDLTKWTGYTQSLHIYLASDEKNLEISSNQDECYLISSSHKEDKYAFGMIMSIKLNESVFRAYETDICNSVIACIKQNINLFTKHRICYDVFYSLGEEDLVLILLGNSIDDFMVIVNMLRNIHVNNEHSGQLLYSQTYSFVFQNSKEYIKRSIIDHVSNACVYLSLNDNINEIAFCDEMDVFLKKQFGENHRIQPSLTIGEYDIKYSFPCFVEENQIANFFELYSNDNTKENRFNGKSVFYKLNIQKSKTIWCAELQKIKELEIDIPKPINYCCQDTNKSRYCSFSFEPNNFETRVNNLISELNDKMSICNDYLFFVYSNVSSFLKQAKMTYKSVSNRQWKYIVSKQTNTFIDSFTKYENLIGTSKEFVSNLNELIDNLEKSLFHINRSKDLFYHIPTNSLQYSGSFNKVLLAYYGYINELLDHAFKKPHDISSNTKQSNIVFFVFFGMSQKICSRIYFNDSNNPNEQKIVGFELPYPALYDLKKYFISLIHEVYHLIAPFNRKERNQKILNLWKLAYIKNEFISYIHFQFSELSDIRRKKVKTVVIPSENTKKGIDKVRLNYNSFLDIVAEYIVEVPISFDGIMVNPDTANYETLNSAIQDYFVRDDIGGYYQELLRDFTNYCKEKIEKVDKKSKSFDWYRYIISSATKLSPDGSRYGDVYRYDKNNFLRIKSIVMCIKECICDTYVIQLGYPQNHDYSQSALFQYLKYLLQFFKSNEIEINSNYDAIFRIVFLMHRYLWYPTEKELISILGKPVAQCIYSHMYSDKINAFSKEEGALISDIISSDDFAVVCGHKYSSEDNSLILENLKRIKTEYIFQIPDDSVNGFSNEQITTIVKLNKPFEFATVDQNNFSIVQKKCIRSQRLSKKEKHDYYIHLKVYRVDSIVQFLDVVRDAKELLSNQPVWYRGLCNVQYKLLPSLYINLPNTDTIPYYYQTALLRESYYTTRKNYDTFLDNEKHPAIRQSLMQHYGIPTNFLDFSTDPLSALFWALNPENEKDKELDSSGIDIPTAAVYIFYPHKYKQAYRYITEYYEKKKEESMSLHDIYGIHTHNSLSEEYIIIDESENHAKELVKRYNECICEYEANGGESILYSKRPLPLVVPQNNIRINAQSGTFVAFNFFAIPIKNKDEEKNSFPANQFNYISLADIQEKYASLCEENGIAPDYLFLERIDINRFSKIKIRDNLSTTFGYSLERAYPDFPRLISDVKTKTIGYNKT